MSQLQHHVNNMNFMFDCNQKREGGISDALSTFVFPQTKVKVVKDGKDINIFHIEYYPDLPKCWVVGFEYKFNSRIIKKEVHRHDRLKKD